MKHKETFQIAIYCNQVNLAYILILLLWESPFDSEKEKISAHSEGKESSHRVSYLDKYFRLYFWKLDVCKYPQFKRGLPATIYTHTGQKSNLALRSSFSIIRWVECQWSMNSSATSTKAWLLYRAWEKTNQRTNDFITGFPAQPSREKKLNPWSDAYFSWWREI